MIKPTRTKTLEQMLAEKLKFSANGSGPISINTVVSKIGPNVYIKLYGIRLPFRVKGNLAEIVE